MATVIARRIRGYEELDEEQICYWHTDAGWLLYMPGCGIGGLKLHTVTENENGTITVQPSIKITGHKDGQPTEVHGYLTNGVWSDV